MTEDWDFVKSTNAHEREMTRMRMEDERNKRMHRTERTKAWATAFGAVTIVAIIIGSIVYIWYGSTQSDREVKIACAEAGATWTSIGRGSPVCVRLEEVQP